MTKLEWNERDRAIWVGDNVAVKSNGRLGLGADDLTEREIAEAFRLYHEHTDPKLPSGWRSCKSDVESVESSCRVWDIAEITIHEFEQVIAWLRWKLEQQSASETESNGG